MMARIAERAERGRRRPGRSAPRQRPEAYGFPEAVAEAACQAARLLHAKAIVAFTQSGFTRAAHLAGAAGRADHRAHAVLGGAAAARPLLGRAPRASCDKVETTDEMLEEVEATLLCDGTVRNNDVIVIISGAPMWVTGTTNLLKLHRVGDRR